MDREREVTGSVMVIGGGIGGVQAALDLAESGFKVYLVESSPAIGGVMAQLDKTFPTNDCSMCILAPKLVECGRHLNIEVLTWSEVLEIEGEPGNFRVRVRKKARFVDPLKCTGCGECAEACPVEVESEFDQGLAKRKAVFRPYPQAFPNVFTIDKKDRPPCAQTCPAGVNVQGYVALISKGKFKEALDLIREELPFPKVMGRICPHPCEAECRRRFVDEPIAIAKLKRFVADKVKEEFAPPRAEPKEEKVAIVGSGPAGLTAAYYLALEGYKVTVFEALPVLGGMLRVGIPAYRLPKDVLDEEIEILKKMGVEFKTGVSIGRDLSIDDLFARGFKAVFLATGAHKSLKLNIPGEDAEGVIHGVEFLRKLNLGERVEIGKRVIVIGGGDVAIDVARSALRLGAEDVRILYRRSRREMPARDEEVEAALEEGVKIEFLVAPVEISVRNGRAAGIRCVRMELGPPDAQGRRRPVPIPGSEFEIEADTIIPAIGQAPDLSYLEGAGIEITSRGTIAADPLTLETSRPGVFAGGDAQTGPGIAIEAVAAGKRAAESIKRFLRGEDLRKGREERERGRNWREIPLYVPRKPRAEAPLLPMEERRRSFKEVELGLSEEAAIEEARRCLNCGVCSECHQCVAACRAEAVNHEMKDEDIWLDVGAVIVAAGFEEFDPKALGEYGYGRYPNVVTSIEFERILSASGPYQGKLVRPSDGKEPKRIAWVQCVGSRSSENPYCSSVCCMYAVKEAVIAKEHATGPLETTIFLMDLRAYGKGFEEYCRRAQEEHGVRFVRSRVFRIEEVGETRDLIVRFADEEGRVRSEEFDLVVLSVGLRPPKDASKLAERLGIELNEYGFCRSEELMPIRTTREGVFACGAFQGPKDIPETVTQASAAAAAAGAMLAPSRHTLTAKKEYPPERDVRGEPPRIGVFICHCGINIGGIVNVPEVTEYAKTLPYVVYAEHNLYTCSQDTQQRIKEKIREHNLNRVVVASCTPRTHEPLFQETLREAGLNPFLFEMANIRDQCSWVHMREPEKATEKAKDLVRAAVARAARLEPLPKFEFEIKRSALVLGGGVAGMTAALNLAEQGFKTYLVEKERELGGWARRIYFGLNGEDPQAFLRDLVNKVTSHPLVEVLTEAKLLKLEGHVGDFRSTVAHRGEEKVIEHGVVIVATGARESRAPEYLLGMNEKVITLSDFEEKLFKNPEELRGAKAAGIILCVRPKDKEWYCSRVCCSSALKNALKLKEVNPEANIYILYRDMRTYGFREELYTRARRAGIIFIRYEEGREPEVRAEEGKIKLEIRDPVLKDTLILDLDLLVLAMPVEAPEENKEISTLLKVPLTKEGFFQEAHVKLRPVDFASDGIFLCGMAHYPKSVEEAVTQALAAAGRAAAILSKDKLEVSGPIAQVDEERCSACRTCVSLCPFGAPRIDEERNVAVVEVAKCRGCGICEAACPSGAIALLHYRREQIDAQIEALL